ncbi:MAG: class I SAM-dependent methyltransferase [Caldilineaceae bacterium]
MTRWQQFYLEDQRVLTVPPSACAHYAVAYFQHANQKLLLDLGCGVGRDTLLLAQSGLQVIGVDAAPAGLIMAQQRNAGHPHSFILVEADARCLPFPAATFAGVYCFGLLHEFVGETATADVQQVMGEIARVLQPGGSLLLAVLAGEPTQGLPQVQMFSEQMLDEVTAGFACIEKCLYDDVGCTGRADYKIWRGAYSKAR